MEATIWGLEEVSFGPLGFVPLGCWVPKVWNMALNKGIWDPKLRGTNIKGTNLTSLNIACQVPKRGSEGGREVTQCSTCRRTVHHPLVQLPLALLLFLVGF